MIHHEKRTVPAEVAARWALRQACDHAGEIGARSADDWTYQELKDVARKIAEAADTLFPVGKRYTKPQPKHKPTPPIDVNKK